MITLTDARSILQTLGDNTSGVNYAKVVVNPITYDNVAKRITATVRLSSTVNTALPELLGTLTVNASTAELVLPQIDFQAHVSLNGAQQSTVQGWLNDSQNQVENGLITLSMMAGSQSTGT